MARAAIFASKITDIGDYDLIVRYFVKLFDTWRIAGLLDEACDAEKAAVSDNRHYVQTIVDVVERVAINQYEVGYRSHREPAEERVGAECGGGVDAGGSQNLFRFQAGGDPCTKLGVQRETGRQTVAATAQL